MEVFDEELSYLQAGVTPKPILDIMRPAARMTVGYHLGYEASRWFLDQTSSAVARAITFTEDEVTEAAAKELRERPFYNSEVSAALSRLAITMQLPEGDGRRFAAHLETTIEQTFEKAVEGALAEPEIVAEVVPEVAIEVAPETGEEIQAEHERIALLVAQKLELDPEAQTALADVLNPRGSTVIYEQGSRAVRAVATYIEQNFGSIANVRLELRDEQQATLRLMTGRWYKNTRGEQQERDQRTLASIIGMRKGLEAAAVEAHLDDAIERVMNTEVIAEELPVAVEREESADLPEVLSVKPRRRTSAGNRAAHPARTPRPRRQAAHSPSATPRRRSTTVKAPTLHLVPPFEDDEPIEMPDDDGVQEKLKGITLSQDPVRDYLRTIGRHQLLKAHEEVELAQQIEVGLFAQERYEAMFDELTPAEARELKTLAREGQRAKETMINANLRLVVSLAKNYTGRGMPFLDLIQEGNLGLTRAIEKFDYKKGFKLSTYATWWIKQSFQRSIADQSRLIRVPVHTHEEIGKLLQARATLYSLLGQEPSDEELAEELSVSMDKIQQIRSAQHRITSLNLKISDESDTELQDILFDTRANAVEDSMDAEDLQENMKKALASVLDDRAAAILCQYYGIGTERMTLEGVGTAHGITRERVRQIVMSSMKRLRASGYVKRVLNDYLDEQAG